MTDSSTIPLFPLSLVLYPSERLPLHVFESRYKKMAGICLSYNSPFGVLCQQGDKLATVGCTARIARVVRRYRDGRLDIVVGGEERFRVLTMHDYKPYLTAKVEFLREVKCHVTHAKIERVITQHMRLLEFAGRTVRPRMYESDSPVSFIIAHNAGLSLDQEQEILELHDEEERVEYLIDHISSLLFRLQRTGDLHRRLRSNGHFKDFPPEKFFK